MKPTNRTRRQRRLEPDGNEWLVDLLDAVEKFTRQGNRQDARGCGYTMVQLLNNSPYTDELRELYYQFKAWGGLTGDDWRRFLELAPTPRRVIGRRHLCLISSRKPKTHRVRLYDN